MIHPTAKISKGAYVSENASIGKGVIIEDGAYIGENVEVGEETYVGKGAILEKNTKVGKRNRIYHYAVIGTPPQHLEYKGEETFVEIGDDNIIREFATIHRGTPQGGGITKIGSKNFIMAYAHIAHDCNVGSECVITSYTALAGHTEVGDRTVFGGLAGTHQFVRVGKLVMVGAGSFPAKDIPPFMLVAGVEARIVGLNIVGLKRAKIPQEDIEKLKEALKIYIDTSLKISDVIDRIKEIDNKSTVIEEFVRFLSSESKRGFLRKHEKDTLSGR